MITITREHTISCGHRVFGHEGKCKNFHGHNYTFELTATADDLDELGRIIDFSAVKESLCAWLELNWDHKFLLWEQDPAPGAALPGIVFVKFNPTAENIADYVLRVVGPAVLNPSVKLIKVRVWETPKCSAEATL